MTVATFNGNPCTTIIYYTPTNASDETDIITFCGPMLATEPNVVWLLVTVLVVAVGFVTTRILTLFNFL